MHVRRRGILAAMRISKKLHLTALLAPLALFALGSGGGGKTDADPFAGANAKLVGDWSGPGTTVHIGADRSFAFASEGGGSKKSYAGTVKRIEEGKRIVVNALVEVNVDVQKLPAEAGGETKMTIEGVEVTKGAAPAKAEPAKAE